MLYLDRDGTINKKHVTRVEDFEFIDGFLEWAAGRSLVVVTNQSCIGYGEMTHADLKKIHEWMMFCCPAIKEVRYCPHRREDACECRKPARALFWDAQEGDIMIGDQESDNIPGLRFIKFSGRWDEICIG